MNLQEIPMIALLIASGISILAILLILIKNTQKIDIPSTKNTENDEDEYLKELISTISDRNNNYYKKRQDWHTIFYITIITGVIAFAFILFGIYSGTTKENNELMTWGISGGGITSFITSIFFFILKMTATHEELYYNKLQDKVDEYDFYVRANRTINKIEKQISKHSKLSELYELTIRLHILTLKQDNKLKEDELNNITKAYFTNK